MTFNYKILSKIDIGNPPQKIEALFDLNSPNFYITNNCKNCSTFYNYKNSKSFSKIETDNKPIGFGNLFYANETFYCQDGITNLLKAIDNLMISIPEINEEEINSDEKNCLRIGLKFPD
jgi:hypothetical protein